MTDPTTTTTTTSLPSAPPPSSSTTSSYSPSSSATATEPDSEPPAPPRPRPPAPSTQHTYTCRPCAQGSRPSPTMDSGMRVEPCGVYVLLWATGSAHTYHWGLLVAQTARTGVVFHQTSVPDTTTTTTASLTSSAVSSAESSATVGAQDQSQAGEEGGEEAKVVEEDDRGSGGWGWRLVMEVEDVASSPGLLCALQVGAVDDVTDEWMAAVKECVRSAEVILPSPPPQPPPGSPGAMANNSGNSNSNNNQRNGVPTTASAGGADIRGTGPKPTGGTTAATATTDWQREDGFSCRTWALAAVFELADGGFLAMVPDRAKLGVIELEAKMMARDTQMVGMRMVRQSVMF